MTQQTEDNEPCRYVWTYEGMEEYIRGQWVDYEDYKSLLDAYEEIKFRMEGLEE